MRVLNVPVSAELRALWRGWLAPVRQPFFLTGEEAAAFDLQTLPRAELTLTPEERDTHAVWGISAAADRVAWLELSDWHGLGSKRQREFWRFKWGTNAVTSPPPRLRGSAARPAGSPLSLDA